MNDKNEETGLRDRFVRLVTDQVDKGVYVRGGNGEIVDELTLKMQFESFYSAFFSS